MHIPALTHPSFLAFNYQQCLLLKNLQLLNFYHELVHNLIWLNELTLNMHLYVYFSLVVKTNLQILIAIIFSASSNIYINGDIPSLQF